MRNSVLSKNCLVIDMKSMEEFIAKYGYDVGDNVVHYSYEHTPHNENLADYTFMVVYINYEAETVDVIEKYHSKHKYEIPARLFSKLPDFKTGDEVIIHKPTIGSDFPGWVGEAMNKHVGEIREISKFYRSYDFVNLRGLEPYLFGLGILESVSEAAFDADLGDTEDFLS